MSDKEWWRTDTTTVGEIANEEYGVTHLHGRETDDGWEYAAVFWRYQAPNLLWVVKNGKLSEVDK